MTNENPRLRAMGLPNGKFLLVLDRCPDGTADQAESALREAVPDGYAIASEYSIEVQDWPNDDLATAAAEACALTHGEDDAAMTDQVRGAFAGLHAKAEAWDMQGALAVERVEVLEAERALLRGMLDEIRALAGSPARVPFRTVHVIAELADRALKDTAA